MKRSVLLLSITAGISYLVLSGYASGPASGGQGNRTGSSAGSVTNCSSPGGCHGTNNASTTINLTLQDQANPDWTATGKYIPGHTYSGILQVSNSAAARYGFQLTTAKAVDQQAGALIPGANQHTFTAGSGSTLITGIEHSAALSSTAGTTAIPFTWTAPAVGTGAVTFYSIVNAVNFNGSADANDHATTKTFVLQEQPLSVASLSENIYIKAYPNPATNQVNLRFDGAEDGVYSIRFVDLSGRLMQQEQITITGNSGTLTVQTSQWAPGLHFAQVMKDGAQRMIPIVKN